MESRPPIPAKPVAEATLRRLPVYHRLLKQLRKDGAQVVSCPQIASELKLDPTQIRKDLEVTGVRGRPKVGYVLPDLIDKIEKFLGWDQMKGACLVGTGSLGSALLNHMRFEEHGVQIVAAFDSDPAKTGKTIRGKEILPVERLPSVAEQYRFEIGILTVPAPAAQGVADLMARSGIRAIWNFAPVRLTLPPQVIVHNEDLHSSLASLAQKLAVRQRHATGI